MFWTEKLLCYTRVRSCSTNRPLWGRRWASSGALVNRDRSFTHRPVRKTFADRLLATVSGMSLRNGGRPMVNWWIRFTSPLVRSWTGGRVRVIYLFSRRVATLGRQSGLAFTASYLKACSVYLMQSVGGMRIKDCCALGPKVARTRGGLPVIIDRMDRIEIRKNNRTIIRFWLTLLNLYRVLEWPLALKPSKLSTIIDEGAVIPGDLIVRLGRFFTESFWPALRKLVGKTSLLESLDELTPKGKIPLWTRFASNLTAEPFIIAKVSATSMKSSPSTALETIYDAALAWRNPINRKGFSYLKEWCYRTGNFISGPDQTGSFAVSIWTGLNQIANRVPSKNPRVEGLALGRLALKREAAGKIRVFAIVDCFTQWLLKPLHKAIFATLKRIPTDGTFDQLKPVRRLLKKSSTLWSYDLSAATDRLPVQVQEQLLHRILGLHGAWHWREVLATRLFALPKGIRVHFQRSRKKFLPPTSRGTLGQWVTSYVDEWVDKVIYAVGQPMGALSSWAMLALVHHALVQYAFFKAQEAKGLRYYWFHHYAVLGDDIIIGKEAVAVEYMKVMTALGVKIGIAKSLISSKKVGEFAKRFFIPRDASPIPLKESFSALSSLPALVEYVRKYKLSPSQVMKFSGYGYKRIGGTTAPLLRLPSKARIIFLALSHPDGAWPRSISHWLGMRSLVKFDTLKPSFWDKFKVWELKRLQELLDSREVLRNSSSQHVRTSSAQEHWQRPPNPSLTEDPLLTHESHEATQRWLWFFMDPWSIRSKIISEVLEALDEAQDLIMKFASYTSSMSLYYIGQRIEAMITDYRKDWDFENRPPDHKSVVRMKGLGLWSVALGFHDRPPRKERGRMSGPTKLTEPVEKAPPVNLSSRKVLRTISRLKQVQERKVIWIPPSSWVPSPETITEKAIEPGKVLTKVITLPRSIDLSRGVSPVRLGSTPFGGLDLHALEQLKSRGILGVETEFSRMLPYEGIRIDRYRTADCGWELYYPDWLLTSRVDPVTGKRMPVRQSRGYGFLDYRVWLPFSHPRSLWNGWYDWKGYKAPYCVTHLDPGNPLYEEGPVPTDGELVLVSDWPRIAKAYADVAEFKIRFEDVFGIDGWGLLNSPTSHNKKLFMKKFGKVINSLPKSNPKTLLRPDKGSSFLPVTSSLVGKPD